MFKKLLFAAVATVIGASGAKAQNIVVDPGFEDGLNGWTSAMGFDNSASDAHNGNNSVLTGCVGHFCVSTYDQGAYVGQTLNTVAGQTYNLSFWVAENYTGGTSEFSVFWNGALVSDVLDPNHYSGTGTVSTNYRQFFINDLLATGTSTDFQVHGRQDPAGIWFDDFSVEASATAAVPEPATWALMIGGFGVVGASMRRRRAITTGYANA